MKYFLPILCGFVLFLTPALGQTPAEKQQTIAALQGLQEADGGFRSSFPNASKDVPRSSLRATLSAFRALKYFGGEPKNAKACAEFISSCFDKAAGGFAEHPGSKPDANTTSIGIMAVVDVKLPFKEYSEAATNYLAANARTFEEVRLAAAAMEALGERSPQTDVWLAQIAKMRNEDGTYGKGDGVAAATGGAVAAVLRLGGKVENRDNVVRALKSGQREDGGFGQEGKQVSDLGTSYRVVRAFHMLKEKPDVERMRAFIAKCRNSDSGYGVAPGQPSTVGSSYNAAIILHWLAE